MSAVVVEFPREEILEEDAIARAQRQLPLIFDLLLSSMHGYLGHPDVDFDPDWLGARYAAIAANFAEINLALSKLDD